MSVPTGISESVSCRVTDDDARRTFTYDHKNTPYSFSLTELTLVANAHFNCKCALKQLSEGGYHKVNVPVLVCHITLVYKPPWIPQVYDILKFEADGTEANRSLDAVIRVASPAFPGDKMRSEVRNS